MKYLDTATFSAGLTGKVAPLPAGDLRFDMVLQRNATQTQIRNRLNDGAGGGAGGAPAM